VVDWGKPHGRSIAHMAPIGMGHLAFQIRRHTADPPPGVNIFLDFHLKI